MATPRPSTLVDASHGPSGEALGYHLVVVGEEVFETLPLPARGDVIVGRGSSADVRIEDPRASRRHARLRLGDELLVEDLGSANGTRVRGRKLGAGQVPLGAAIAPGEAIKIGALVLMVQPSQAPRAGRVVLGQAAFAARVDWECARCEATGEGFTVARVPSAGLPLPGPTSDVLRPADVVGRTGPGAYGLLLPELYGLIAARFVRGFAETLGEAGGRVGIATYPHDGRTASALLGRAAARARGEESNSLSGDAPEKVVCVEDSMRRVYALAARAAKGSINVVILGETGVGKEVLARWIHDASPRAARPFVALNCGAFVESLLESELFGHERGAFTGAEQAKEGLLETADGGTVLLDEVGDLPAAAQAKLLRVVETREVLRVGGTRARKIDVRFLAATNRDLAADAASGAFRSDLYYRLNGLTLTIPPLRERPRDIPVLARSFLRGIAPIKGHRRVAEISEGALAWLMAHAWPGNVRELASVVESALLVGDGEVIREEDLPRERFHAKSTMPRPSPAARREGPSGSEVERDRFLAALAACGGNQSRAAKKLGVSRKVLIARLDAYGVARPRKTGRT